MAETTAPKVQRCVLVPRLDPEQRTLGSVVSLQPWLCGDGEWKGLGEGNTPKACLVAGAGLGEEWGEGDPRFVPL